GWWEECITYDLGIEWRKHVHRGDRSGLTAGRHRERSRRQRRHHGAEHPGRLPVDRGRPWDRVARVLLGSALPDPPLPALTPPRHPPGRGRPGPLDVK